MSSGEWRLAEASPLFGMLGAARPGHGLLGVSDPDVHRRDGVWTMFLGAFTTRFAVRIVEARLPPGATVDDDSWQFVTGRGGRAVTLGAPPDRRAWDAAGMHTPSYVNGPGAERIYYAGRRTRRITGPGSRYAIGCLERRDGAWRRRPGPVLTGDAARPSVLEPFVLHADGRWRMWFLSAIGETGRGEQPDYQLRYTESDDGLRWETPGPFATAGEGFFDNTVAGSAGRWRMLLARGTNLYGTTPFPEQGLWLAEATVPGDRPSWSPPRRLLDTGSGAASWYAAGVCGPAAVVDGPALHVFATGTHDGVPWWRAALGELRAGRRPPAPAPYFLTTGRFTFRRT
jgi:hypothetical protein